MKSILFFAFLCATIYSVSSQEKKSALLSLKCENEQPNIPDTWRDMKSPCINAVRGQIQKEFEAAIIYLRMGAHFSKDTVNLLGFAKFFFESASEEREHGTKLIEYLLLRGATYKAELASLITYDWENLQNLEWSSGVDALRDALETEANVTLSIREVIKKCEAGYNDYHLVDYLTGVYLEEQYEGQRKIAGMISTVDKMMKSHGPIGQFLYDKKMLE